MNQPLNPVAALMTMSRYIDGTDYGTQMLLVNTPRNASDPLLFALCKLSICQDEHEIHLGNADAGLHDLFNPLIEVGGAVIDRLDYRYGVDKVDWFDQKQLDAFDKLYELMLTPQVCVESLLKDTFDLLVMHKDSFNEVTKPQSERPVADAAFNEENAHISPLNQMLQKNPETGKLLALLIDYVEQGYKSLEDVESLASDLATI